MGFFGNMFKKKVCDLCGEEIGLFGNRKLEDGNCCKECASKLSPWFSERRQSTVEEIRAQLQYREENKGAVAAFHTTRTLGNRTKVYVDEDAGKFMVTSARDFAEANPDVLDLSQVTGCTLKIDESQREVMREVEDTENGGTKRISYSPRRYRFLYSFKIQIDVNHPYFDDICFDLSESDIEIRSCSHYGSLEGVLRAPTLEQRRDDVEYAQCEEMGMEIKELLTKPREAPSAAPVPASETAPEEPVSAPAPAAAAVVCPWCGTSTVPDADGCCPCCGGNMNG